ncbi:MAG: hypothetical protein PHG48_06245 [Eubacteriales bacterium]|nr:hypothetical protein [Eubacteriales bacterium]
MKKIRFTDIILFPKSLYEKFGPGRVTAIPGIIAIGIIDVIWPVIIIRPEVFTAAAGPDLIFNISLALMAIIVAGALDVLFFSLPAHDMLCWIGKKSGKDYSGVNIIRMFKIYMMSHVLIIPLNMVLMLMPMFFPSLAGIVFLNVLDLYFTFVVPVWFAAVIFRGINTVYKLEKAAKRMVYVLVLLWTVMLSYALDYLISGLLLDIFR